MARLPFVYTYPPCERIASQSLSRNSSSQWTLAITLAGCHTHGHASTCPIELRRHRFTRVGLNCDLWGEIDKSQLLQARRVRLCEFHVCQLSAQHCYIYSLLNVRDTEFISSSGSGRLWRAYYCHTITGSRSL